METKINKTNDFETKLSENFEIKSIDGTGRFSGYASVFNIKDNYRDIILPNAFRKTLQNRNIKSDIKLLWQHSSEEPIGYFESMREDNVGLLVEGKILLDVEKGREAYSLIKSGAISGLSIGYNVVKADFDKKSGIRVISEIDLWEVSVVTFPANRHSKIIYCKNYDPNFDSEVVDLFDKNCDKLIFAMNVFNCVSMFNK